MNTNTNTNNNNNNNNTNTNNNDNMNGDEYEMADETFTAPFNYSYHHYKQYIRHHTNNIMKQQYGLVIHIYLLSTEKNSQ